MSIISIYKRLEEYINTPTIFDLGPYYSVVEKINSRYSEWINFNLNELKTIHQKIQTEIEVTEIKESIIVEAFALIKVLSEKILGQKAYDVQLVTGLVLYEGRIAEMKTGEGKTLAALFPTYLRACEKKGIHVHSFNEYLSKRDHAFFHPIFDFLGIKSDCLKAGMSKEKIELALQADVTYGSAKEFIYTYLKRSLDNCSSDESFSRFYYTIIDEADAILLDEATNPFVIAGSVQEFSVDFYKIAKMVKQLVEKTYFGYNDFKRGVFLTEEGIDFVGKSLNIENLYEEANQNILSAINLSLHAHLLLKKDVDYIVKNNDIILVDEFTGRIVEDRKWRNGLQTAVEAKEGCPIKSEGLILNSISIPNFYKQYKIKAAMTATARESSVELNDSYRLELVVIPPNVPSKQIDYENRVFKNRDLKYQAIINKVIQLHSAGRPVLIGTQHISESELVFNKLEEKGIHSNILNAKNDELEAEIISNAGMLNAVTISTNMAGRGTDIKLGGEKGIDKEKVELLGGLFVIGTNMHRSGRIDRQLKGRAARQGEAGASQFFVSMEDDLFDKNNLRKVLAKKFKFNEEDEIVDIDIHMFLSHAQEVSEDQDNLLRETINKYSAISYLQAQLINQLRNSIWKNEKYDVTLKNALVEDIDMQWSGYISQLFEVKDGIHFISLGGQNPLRAFEVLADRFFKDLLKSAQEFQIEIQESYLNDKNKFEKLTQNKKPSSTWTYTASDKGFNAGLEGLFKGSSNIAFQLDFLGVTVLFFKYWWKKITDRFRLK